MPSICPSSAIEVSSVKNSRHLLNIDGASIFQFADEHASRSIMFEESTRRSIHAEEWKIAWLGKMHGKMTRKFARNSLETHLEHRSKTIRKVRRRCVGKYPKLCMKIA